MRKWWCRWWRPERTEEAGRAGPAPAGRVCATSAAGLGVLALLGGCCVNERCDCPGQAQADTIFIRFDRDTSATGQGFRWAETDTVWLVRMPLNPAETPRRDSVLFVRGRSDKGYDLSLRQQAPFASNVNKANRYEYLIYGPHLGGRRFSLTDITISGRYATVSACCTCYENNTKSARLNGGSLLNLRSANGEPVYIELRK